MMNYYYPLEDEFDQDDAKKLLDLNLCLVYFEKQDFYALALTGGGMDLSWDIIEAHIRLGYYPPLHFRPPRFAGMKQNERYESILDICVESRNIVKGWMESDIKDLERVREYLRSNS